MKTILNILAFLVILSMGFACGFVVARNYRNTQIVKLVPTENLNKVYNIFEMQERLKAQGLYGGKIDGLWGPLMDKAYCDYCAIRAIEELEKE